MIISEVEVREWAINQRNWIFFASATMRTDPKKKARKHLHCAPSPMMAYEVTLDKDSRVFGSLTQAVESYNTERWVPDTVTW